MKHNPIATPLHNRLVNRWIVWFIKRPKATHRRLKLPHQPKAMPNKSLRSSVLHVALIRFNE